MSPKAIASICVGVGFIFLISAVVCRLIILKQAMSAGVSRSFWLEKVDFPGRTKIVWILGFSLVLGAGSMVMGMIYSGKAAREKAATTESSKAP
jgi:hypothetical protein